MDNTANKAKYKRWWMLFPLILSGVWFYLLEIMVTKPDFFMYMPLDDYIPFVPLFVVPYVIWYGYVAVTALFLFFKSPEEFVKTALFLTLGMMAACLVYTIFPNGQTLRPSLQSGAEPLTLMIGMIYSADTPANSAPSIHVIYSIAAHAGIAGYNGLRRRSVAVNVVSAVVAALCTVSTVFIKQHSIIDLTTGLLVSGLLYALIYKRKPAKQ